MKILESAENYLETILMLHNQKGMKNLRENGYIEVSHEGFISLLPSGLEIAEKMLERHTLLTKWLTALGVSPEVAAEDACRMEHVLSAETFAAIKAHVLKADET